jgi:LuxR family maltose regulon positive regulatory protein
MGKHAEAAELAEAVIEWARETGSFSMLLEARSFASRLALLSGQVLDIENWAAPLGEDFSVMLLLEIPHLTEAAVLIARGTPGALQEADELLGRVRQFVEFTHNTWRLIEVLTLQALLQDTRGERKAALELLQQAVELAQPGGFIRLFVDLGSAMARLLDRLRWQGVATEYITQILIAFETTRQGIGDDADARSLSLVEPLTPRELEVVALLASHLSNIEIAEELVISPGTVKTHTLNIYRKLEVHGRKQAVARTRELNILPPE